MSRSKQPRLLPLHAPIGEDEVLSFEALAEPSPVVGTFKASLWLGVSERTIRRLCRDGKLEGAYQPSGFQGSWLIPLEALQAIRSVPARPLSETSDEAEGAA